MPVPAQNLKNYVFMQKKRFLQNPHAGIEYASFLGEVYEAYFYEILLDLVIQERLSLRLVAKGPYVASKKYYVKTGFSGTGDGKCVYNMQGVSFAEFDCLAVSQDTVYFYECSVSPKCSMALKRELLKKKALLGYLFPTHRIVPVVVSEHDVVVRYCERWHEDGIEAWKVTMPPIDCVALATSNQPQVLPKPKELIGLHELNYAIATTPYFEQLERLTRALAHSDSLAAAYDECADIQRDWFSRLYWGKVAGKELSLEAAHECEEVIVVVDFSKNVYPVLRYYVHEAHSQHFFELTPKLELLKRLKFSRLELMKLQPLLRLKSVVAFESLQQELKQLSQKKGKQAPLSQAS